MSTCPSRKLTGSKCSKAHPEINKLNIKDYPEIKTYVESNRLENSKFYRCSYCGLIWEEYLIEEHSYLMQKKIATTDLSDHVTWYI